MGSIASYAWNFGDGTTATTTSATTTHTYAASGTYNVTLTVTNTQGTSTAQTFTGQTVSNNGGPSATTTQAVSTAGYDLAGSDGGVFVFPVGQATGFFGSLPGLGVKVDQHRGHRAHQQLHRLQPGGFRRRGLRLPGRPVPGFFGSLPGLEVRSTTSWASCPPTTTRAMTWWDPTAGSSSSRSASRPASTARCPR